MLLKECLNVAEWLVINPETDLEIDALANVASQLLGNL